ncbi:MAG: hypothetical protein CL484_10525 [Acidobacteria bacterium]|nr:hypothetical protein [Acidobacteriota bacterium]
MIGHARFIRQAIELAAQAARKGDEPFGALLVVDSLPKPSLYASTEPCVMCCGAITHRRLEIPSRHILGLGRRYVEVIGPVLEPDAVAVHRSCWSEQT